MKNLLIRPQISIIIVSYNCWDYLDACLKSLSLIDEPHEVIVVDNNSGDDTDKNMRTIYPQHLFLANNYNAGFSLANNQGFVKATGKYVLFLNPDAALTDKNYRKAIVHLEKNSNDIVGPKLLNTDGSDQDSVFEVSNVKSIFMEAFFLSYFIKKSLTEILSQKNIGLSGACLLMNAELYKKLAGFNNNLFWMEDIDLCRRAVANGGNLLYLPEWQVLHHVGQSGKKNYNVAIANQLISKLKYMRMYASWSLNLLASLGIALHILFRMLVFGVLSPFKAVYRSKFFAYCHTQTVFFKYIFTGKTNGF